MQDPARHGNHPARGISDTGDRTGPGPDCRFGHRARRQVGGNAVLNLRGDHLDELILAVADKVEHVLCIVRQLNAEPGPSA